MSTSTTANDKRSSPLPSSPDHFAPSSPRGAVNISKSLDDVVPSQMTHKPDTNVITEKEIPTRASNAMRNKPGGKRSNGSKPTDLQSLLIFLLKDKPNGMSIKTLEKAVIESLPSSIKDFKPIIKRIAKYQPPGRYILKPSVDSESIKKPQIESGRAKQGLF